MQGSFQAKLSARNENKEIADVLGISLRTVEAHMYKALKYLRSRLDPLWIILFLFYEKTDKCFYVLNCIINMKEKKMSNLSEDIINRYLTGQCSEEELIEVNAWMKESEENALRLFRMEEIYHLGKFGRYTDGQRILRAENSFIRNWTKSKGNGIKYCAYIVG